LLQYFIFTFNFKGDRKDDLVKINPEFSLNEFFAAIWVTENKIPLHVHVNPFVFLFIRCPDFELVALFIK
jgi:hypothetical protein